MMTKRIAVMANNKKYNTKNLSQHFDRNMGFVFSSDIEDWKHSRNKKSTDASYMRKKNSNILYDNRKIKSKFVS